MLLGTSKAVITPPMGTPLAGYGTDRLADSVLDELELRAFWLQPNVDSPPDAVVCIITADIIGFGGGLTGAVRAGLAEALGLAPHSVILAASHTHSGPQTLDNLSSAGGAPVPAYIADLRETLCAAVAEARASVRAVTMSAGRGELTGFAINRRLLVDGEAQMRPNPQGVRDDEVTAITFQDAATGDPIAILYHYTCHPTTMGDTHVTGDYPAAARRHVEEALPGTVAGFLPGCFGDVRPACTLLGARAFRSGGPADVREFGAALGAEVVRITREASRPVTPKLTARLITAQLPLAEALQTAPMPIQRVDLADEVTLVAMGGEICVDYGLFVKGLRPGEFMVPMGYTNEVITYVASERMFPERGYEVDGAWPWFGQPSAFDPSVERVIQQTIRDTLAG